MATDIVAYVTPDAELGNRLLPVARRIFTETFGSLYETLPFEAFCDGVYGPGGSMDRDLKDPDVRWLVATVSDKPIGYAKLTPLRAPVTSALPGAMELQQIYVLSVWQGAGVADELMKWAISIAFEQGTAELYLTVFDHNERAKRFYTRYAFREIGRCSFQLGDRIDDDRIWCRRLR